MIDAEATALPRSGRGGPFVFSPSPPADLTIGRGRV